MIRHIVMWKLKEELDGASRLATMQKVKTLLEGCSNCVPGILEFEVGLAGPDLEATFDVVLNSLFVNREALDAYQQHPTHVAIKPFMGSVRAAREAMDYELPAAS